MDKPGLLTVQVVFVQPGSVWEKRLHVPAGSILSDVVQACGVLDVVPQSMQEPLRVGIWGRECALDHPVGANDRIEVYRPLIFDPLESRRRRAAHRRSAMNKPAARVRCRKLSRT